MIRAVAIAVVTLVLAGGADAAYPGKNGRIAFLSNRGGGGYRLFTMRTDGTGVKLVAAKADPHSPPSWSPNGRRIVYTTTAGSRLATIAPNGSGKHVFPFIGWWGTWAPGGARLAFENEADGIDGVAAAGGAVTPIAEDAGAGDLSKWQPSWSPGGKRIAYVSGAGDHSGAIWTMKADGTNRTRLTNGDARGEIDSAPDWSPNGRTIAFQRYVDCAGGTCKNAIFTIRATGGTPKLVLRNAATPSWSPNGKRIAFVRGGDVWTMDATGTNLRRLTSSPAADAAPDWQPSF